MKRRLLIALSIIFSALLVIAACNKDLHSPVNVGQEKLAGSYLMTGLTQQEGPKTTNLFATVEECEKDNLQVLKADMTYKIVDAGMSCEPASTEDGIWNIAGNKLTLDGQIFTIERFTEHQMVLSTTFTFGSVAKTVTATYKRQ